MGSTLQARRKLLAALLLSGAVGSAEAQTTRAPEALAGEYGLVAEQSDDVARVVGLATRGRSWPVRTLMRDRLKKTLRAPATLRISVAGEQVTVTASGEPPVRAVLGGAAIPWTHPSGERMQVQARRAGEALALTFHGRAATREQTYRLRGDGRTLELRVTLSGEKLGGEPITYTLVYARAGEGAAR